MAKEVILSIFEKFSLFSSFLSYFFRFFSIFFFFCNKKSRKYGLFFGKNLVNLNGKKQKVFVFGFFFGKNLTRKNSRILPKSKICPKIPLFFASDQILG